MSPVEPGVESKNTTAASSPAPQTTPPETGTQPNGTVPTPTTSSADTRQPGPWSPARWLRGYRPSTRPLLSRANFRFELTSAFFLPFLLAGVEGGVMGVIVRNAFEGVVGDRLLNTAVGVVAAAPAFANIISFLWVRLSHGVPKIRFINRLQVCMIGALILIALAPQTSLGLALVLLGVVGARACHSGVVTLRSQVWAANYPRDQRAQVSGRFATVGMLIITLIGTGLGLLMSATTQLVGYAPTVNALLGLDPAWTDLAFALSDQAYRIALPVMGLAGAVGIYFYSRIRVRGEGRALRDERERRPGSRPSANPAAMIALLRDDPRYARFMLWQFLLGTGNMMGMAVLIIVLRERFGLGYEAVILTHTIPLGMMTLAIPFWARYLDRVNIIRFRAVHSWVFVAVFALATAGIGLGLLWLIYLASALRGVAFGGGALAWNLGHHDLAPKDQASQYMAVHVTLTGVRGLVMPLLGVQLYLLIAEFVPAEVAPGIAGTVVFGICLASLVVGTLGFVAMDRADRRRAGSDDPDAPRDAPGEVRIAGAIEANAPGLPPVVCVEKKPKARDTEGLPPGNAPQSSK